MEWLVLILCLFLFFDIHYFLRFVFSCLVWVLRTKLTKASIFLEDTRTYGICFTTDLDPNLHMNNSRFLRECDFGRVHYLIYNNLVPGYLTSTDIKLMLSAITVRYRKEINLFTPFRIRTKMVCWEEKALFFEQRIERLSDSFICAIVYAKYACMDKTPAELMQRRFPDGPRESPEMPEEIRHWKQCNQVSSMNLRHEANTGLTAPNETHSKLP